MNLLSSLNFLRRSAPQAMPEHVKVRYVVAAKSDNTKLARKRAETTAALRRIVTEQKLVAAVKAALEESTAAGTDRHGSVRMTPASAPQPEPQDRIGGLGNDPQVVILAAGTQAPPVEHTLFVADKGEGDEPALEHAFTGSARATRLMSGERDRT